MDENYSDWAGFFDDNDFLVRKENLFQMPNNMYLMKFKASADISSSLIQLSNSPAINKIIRAWQDENASFLFPLNKFVVFFKEKIATHLADSIAQANGIIEYRIFLGKDNCYLFTMQNDYYENALRLANQIYEAGLADYSKVGFIIPIESNSSPNDPLFPYQWNLKNTGQGGGTTGADIDMDEAWEYAHAPDPGQNDRMTLHIAILDDGIADHEDIVGYGEEIYYTGYPPFDPPGPPSQFQFHGEAIAGILKGKYNNEEGMAGILRAYNCIPYGEPYCELCFPLWCMVICGPPDDFGNIRYTTDLLMAEAIHDASYSKEAFAISISYNLGYSSLIDTEISQVYNNGTTIFAAAGNACSGSASGGLDYPARNDKVIGVGASDYNDQRTAYSNFGIFNPAYGQIGVDFLAPSRFNCYSGVGIVTTDQMGIYNGKILEDGLSCFDTTLSADYMCDFGGTSAACPEAAAIAMLIFARRSDWRTGAGNDTPPATINIAGVNRPTPEVIREIIRYSSEDVVNNDEVSGVEDTAWINEEYGWGRVNAARALLAISRGDANNDAKIDTLDMVYLINYKYYGGSAPVPNVLIGDANCDGAVNILDVVYIINYIYKSGPRPPLCYKY